MNTQASAVPKMSSRHQAVSVRDPLHGFRALQGGLERLDHIQARDQDQGRAASDPDVTDTHAAPFLHRAG